MSNIKEAYKNWSVIYDTNLNKTRDLEAVALRKVLSEITFDQCLEVGCGTGKNTIWFANRAKKALSIDLSDEMLEIAKKKINTQNIEFKQVDINNIWDFTDEKFDLVSFSLVLEHIENLDHIFKEASQKLSQNGFLYLGELHPFKQYSGSKARFETDEGIKIVDCFNHHITDFINAASKHGLHVKRIEEFFDDDNRNEIPRILSILFSKD